MNKERRKRIEEACEQLQPLLDVLQECRDEEQDYYDNMPESFQQGERGTQAEGNVSILEDMISKLEEVQSDAGSIEGGS